MARVKLDLPSVLPFSTEITVRVTDLNYREHVGNDTILSYFQEARWRYLASVGMTEKDAGGAGIIMVDAVVVYRSEIFYGETLRIDVGTTEHHSLGFDFVYRISGVASGKESARGKTGVVFFDYEKRKVVPMPARFREAMVPRT